MIVWFNGPSQKELLFIPQQPVEIGCNYITQVRRVDHVVCYDAEVINNIEIEQGIKYHTRSFWAQPPVWNEIENDYGCGINSGLLAIILAKQLTKDNIYVIGCDWGLEKSSVFKYAHKTNGRKYSNAMSDVLKELNKTNQIKIVNDRIPDVQVPVISKFEFLQTIQ